MNSVEPPAEASAEPIGRDISRFFGRFAALYLRTTVAQTFLEPTIQERFQTVKETKTLNDRRLAGFLCRIKLVYGSPEVSALGSGKICLTRSLGNL